MYFIILDQHTIGSHIKVPVNFMSAELTACHPLIVYTVPTGTCKIYLPQSGLVLKKTVTTHIMVIDCQSTEIDF